MSSPALSTIMPGCADFPAALAALANPPLWLLGNTALLHLPCTALLCSRTCPSSLILSAYDLARGLRDAGTAVISPFHTPIERDALHFLLKGSQPIVVCLGRSITEARLPAAWRPALADGRLLVISACAEDVRRTTADSSYQATLLAGALAERILVVHASPGGRLEYACEEFRTWGKQVESIGR